MKESIKNRLAKLEAAHGDVASFVVVVQGQDETVEQAIARETEHIATDDSTLVVCIRRFTDYTPTIQ